MAESGVAIEGTFEWDESVPLESLNTNAYAYVKPGSRKWHAHPLHEPDMGGICEYGNFNHNR